MTLIIKTTGWEDYLGTNGAYIKALIMGPPGAGKTRSASFWPSPIFADCEEGRMSIADRGVPYAQVRSNKDMDDLLDHIAQDAKRGANRRYQTLVIDTLDSYQRTLIQERLASERKEALSGWADWGHLDAKITQFVEKMLNLPMNIVVNLHVKETIEGDDNSKQIVMAPKLKGDIKDQIAAEFDLVGFMSTHWEAQGGERALARSIRWLPEPKYPILKDRSGRLPNFTTVDFTDDDFYRIRDAIVGDFVEDMPETTVLEELGEPVVVAEPAGPDEQGGAVVTVRDFPRRKRDAEVPPEPPAEPVTVEKSEPKPSRKKKVDVPEEKEETETPVAPEAETAEEADAGSVTQESDAPADEPKKEAPRCGDQPETRRGKADPAPGCGKSLADENRDRVNVALIRTNTYLCNDCFQQWKNAN